MTVARTQWTVSALAQRILSSSPLSQKTMLSKSVRRGLVTANALRVPRFRYRSLSSVAPGPAFTSPSPNDADTHFGFQTIKEQDKERMVGEVFRRVADNYDVMNDLMSAGVHRLWKDEFVRMIGPIVPARADEQVSLLDVAGGTGDIAFRLFDGMQKSYQRARIPPHITVCDINPRMLAVGEERAAARGYAGDRLPAGSPRLAWVQGDAEKLPFADGSMDLFTIAFGIRNVTHVDRAIAEAYRVLKPGGRFMCLEFSRVTNPLLQQAYDAYSFAVIPALGAAVANDRASYQYLVESIRKFPDQDTFAGMIEDAGFRHVRYRNMTFGIAAVHSGFKL